MSSECVELNELVSAFADGELDGEREARVRGHLDGCAECRAFVSACRRIDRAAGERLRPPEVERARWDAMLAQLRAAGGQPARRSRIRPVKAVAFVSTLVAACLLAAAAFLPWDTPEPTGNEGGQHVSIDAGAEEYEVVTVAAPEGGVSMMLVIDTDAEEEDNREEKKRADKRKGGEK